MNIEMGTAIALVGAGIFQIHDAYSGHAGKLNDVRNATPGDNSTRLRLQDADVLVGAIALVVGGSLTLASAKVYPLFLAVLGFALVSSYYHLAFNTSSIAEVIE